MINYGLNGHFFTVLTNVLYLVVNLYKEVNLPFPAGDHKYKFILFILHLCYQQNDPNLVVTFIAMQEAHLLKFHYHWLWPGKFSVMVFSDNSRLNKSNWKFNAGRFSIVRNKVSWECLCWPWNWIQINVKLIIWWLLVCTCY